MGQDGRLVEAQRQYERAIFGGAEDALELADQALDAVEADLALARGRMLRARFLATREDDPHELEYFERALELYQELGDVRGEADARFWVGTYHQSVHGDHHTALPLHTRSYELASQVDDKLIMSYAVRHIAFAELAAGDLAAAREHFEESVRLRREIGFAPGVAAGLLALAELDLETGDRDAASRKLAEAATIAKACGAHGTLGWISAAQEALG